jgi:rhodanese-related sulfurtransferase
MVEVKARANVATISKDALAEKLNNREPVQVVNVLKPDYYHLGFIKDSLKIPLDELDRRIGELDKNREVITYCAHSQCPASSQAAVKLAAKGFQVRAYEGGIKEWKEAGLPTE